MGRIRVHVARAGTTLLVAGILAAASPRDGKVPVEIPPGMAGSRNITLVPSDMPPPGSCRLWYPDRKPADQPRPGPCAALTRDTPTGAWVLHRAPDGKRLLRLQ